MSLKVNRNVGTLSLEKNSIRSGGEKIRIKNWSNFGRSRPAGVERARDETPCRIGWLIRFVTAQTDKTERRDHSYRPWLSCFVLVIRTLEQHVWGCQSEEVEKWHRRKKRHMNPQRSSNLTALINGETVHQLGSAYWLGFVWCALFCTSISPLRT